MSIWRDYKHEQDSPISRLLCVSDRVCAVRELVFCDYIRARLCDYQEHAAT